MKAIERCILGFCVAGLIWHGFVLRDLRTQIRGNAYHVERELRGLETIEARANSGFFKSLDNEAAIRDLRKLGLDAAATRHDRLPRIVERID